MLTRQSEFERQLLADVSSDQLWTFVSTIAQWQRMSGSAEERAAMDYIAATLRSWDVAVERYEHDAYVSEPGSARLTVRRPEERSIDCITHSFAASGQLSAELAYVGSGEETRYDEVDATGKIVVVEGLATPGKVLAAELHGAVGAIFINEDNLHQMIVSPVWGTPTPETAARLPTIQVASIRRADGERLKTWLELGPVTVELATEVRTSWARLPIVIGAIAGTHEPERYVLLSGHVDSWFYGAMDNAAANATMLETMRILATHRDRLRRGFRVMFMSGHSHGRYAGSTWYADTFWEELYDRCVAHVNVDSTGATGATFYGEQLGMRETAQLAREVLADLTGQEAEVSRIGRAGDQSFWGIGIPALYMSLSKVPMENASASTRAMAALTGRSRSATPWFWHTEHDTIDKIDRAVLEQDTRVYVATIARLASSPVLPYDYTGTVDELLAALERYQEQVGAGLDLRGVIERARALRGRIETLNQRIDDGIQDEPQRALVNQALVDLGRILIPINFTDAGPFDHDLALQIPVVPALAGALALARLEPASDQYRFLQTKLVRQRNRVSFALRQARQRVDDTLAALDHGA